MLVYSVNYDAGDKHFLARDMLMRAVRVSAILTLQALGEFYHVTTRKYRLPSADSRAFIDDWTRIFPIVTAQGPALDNAIDAVERHSLSFWDALLWATVEASGSTVLFTEDLQDGRRLGRVSFVNPFDPANQRIVDTLLPPNGDGRPV